MGTREINVAGDSLHEAVTYRSETKLIRTRYTIYISCFDLICRTVFVSSFPLRSCGTFKRGRSNTRGVLLRFSQNSSRPAQVRAVNIL